MLPNDHDIQMQIEVYDGPAVDPLERYVPAPFQMECDPMSLNFKP